MQILKYLGLYCLTCSSFSFSRIVMWQDAPSFTIVYLFTELSSVINPSLPLTNLNCETNLQHFKGIFSHQPRLIISQETHGATKLPTNFWRFRDLEFASLCWATYKCSNNIVYPKFITNYEHIIFYFEICCISIYRKRIPSLPSNFFFMSLDKEALKTITTPKYIPRS